MDLTTWKAKILNALTGVLAVLLVIGGVAPDLISVLGTLASWLPGGSKVAVGIGLVLAFLTRLPSITAKVRDLIEKLKATGPAALLLLAALNLGAPGCAWYQRNGGKINCVGIATVENAPALVQIVRGCATIAVNTSAIVPCIVSAAGSQWAEDVIACFAADVAGAARCPAALRGAASDYLSEEARARLREAVAQEWGGRL
jgi:hypothetical protein